MQAKSYVHTKKKTFSFSVSPRVKESIRYFSIHNRGHLRVLLRNRTSDKAHELFNLLFLSILSIEGILRYEVSKYSRRHEQFFKYGTVFLIMYTFKKHVQNMKRNIFLNSPTFSEYTDFFYKILTLFDFVHIF